MNLEHRPIYLLQDYKGSEAKGLHSASVHLPKQNLKNKTVTNNWSITMSKFGGNKGVSSQPNSIGNWKFKQLFPSLENVGLYWGIQASEYHHYTTDGQCLDKWPFVVQIVVSLWDINSQCCWEWWYRNEFNFLNSLKKDSWSFTFMTCTMNFQKFKPWPMVLPNPFDSIICLWWN